MQSVFIKEQQVKYKDLIEQTFNTSLSEYLILYGAENGMDCDNYFYTAEANIDGVTYNEIELSVNVTTGIVFEVCFCYHAALYTGESVNISEYRSAYDRLSNGLIQTLGAEEPYISEINTDSTEEILFVRINVDDSYSSFFMGSYSWTDGKYVDVSFYYTNYEYFD